MPDIVTLVATLCLVHGGGCIEKTFIDRLTKAECGGDYAEKNLPLLFAESPYMEQGYRLVGWRCLPYGTPT